MDPLFDVYVTGQTLDGRDRVGVIASLSRLFGIEQQAAAQLLQGARRRVKSRCDKAIALKYREALTAAGAEVVVERHGDAVSEMAGMGVQPATRHQATFTSADKTPLFGEPASADVPIEWTSDSAPEPPVGQPTPPSSSWDLAPTGAIMSEHVTRQPPPPISVPELNLAEPGALIPNLPSQAAPMKPETAHLQLKPLGP